MTRPLNQPVRVGMVARCLNSEHMRGMGKYVYELLAHGRQQPALQWRLYGDDPRYGMLTPPDSTAEVDIFPFRGDRFQAWEQLGLPLRARSNQLDLLHCSEGSLPLWQPIPTVVTVHDTLAWEERDDTAGARLYFDRLLPAALKASTAVITISANSQTDILARFPWLEHKLSVIPHGIDAAFFDATTTDVAPAGLWQRLAGAPYALYVGGPMQRKRADWAIAAFAACQQPDLKLVLCGFGSAARRTAEQALEPQLRGRVLFAEFVSDAELRALYRGARAVLYPTLYEGFGFPALEAQAAGTPVLMSALGSLKELIGPLAMVLPAHDLVAWSAALDQACQLGETRAALAAKTAPWVRQFVWQTSFERHHALYRRVAGKEAAR